MDIIQSRWRFSKLHRSVFCRHSSALGMKYYGMVTQISWNVDYQTKGLELSKLVRNYIGDLKTKTHL